MGKAPGPKLKNAGCSEPQNSKMGNSPGPKLENKMSQAVSSSRIGVVSVYARRAYVAKHA
jgi:hypothetical protein